MLGGSYVNVFLERSRVDVGGEVCRGRFFAKWSNIHVSVQNHGRLLPRFKRINLPCLMGRIPCFTRRFFIDLSCGVGKSGGFIGIVRYHMCCTLLSDVNLTNNRLRTLINIILIMT